MAENIAFPSILAPSSMTERLKANTRVHTSPVSGVSKTVENPGTRWELELGYSGLNYTDLTTEMMVSAIAKLRGQAKRLQVHNMARPETTGTLDVPNLITNGNFVLGNTGWTETPDTGGRVSFANGKVRLESGTGTANISSSVTMVVSTYYSVHIAISAGSSDIVRVAVGGSTNDFTGSGRHVAGFSASGTTDIVITNLTNNTSVYVSDVVVARAGQSVGVDQTGSVINVDGLGGVSDEVIKANDFIGINGELRKVVETVVSDSGGIGEVIISPPMHNLVPDNSVIVLNRPFSKFILNEDHSSLNISAPFTTGFGLNLIEDLS